MDWVDFLTKLASGGGYAVLVVFVVLLYLRKLIWYAELEATNKAHDAEIARLMESCKREREVLTERAEMAEKNFEKAQELTTEMVRHSSRMAEVTRVMATEGR